MTKLFSARRAGTWVYCSSPAILVLYRPRTTDPWNDVSIVWTAGDLANLSTLSTNGCSHCTILQESTTAAQKYCCVICLIRVPYLLF